MEPILNRGSAAAPACLKADILQSGPQHQPANQLRHLPTTSALLSYPTRNIHYFVVTDSASTFDSDSEITSPPWETT
eukprot:scaffold26315_cov80-Skeletonema_marinoi.AAC.1